MKYVAAVAVACLLGGCATPQEMRAESERHEFTSARAPADVARCIARIGEEQTPLAYPTATVREGGTPGSREVQIRQGDHTSFVADVVPVGSGSRATVYRYRGIVTTGSLPAVMAKSC